MIRKIVEIDKDKCNGCGLCVKACHESAIEIVDGKATLSHDHYCDGLGDCLPNCPQNAISIIEREAVAYDEEAVKKNIQRKHHWPVQLKLSPVVHENFEGCDLLVAATCSAFAYSQFHEEFMKNKITLVGCSKLDDIDYSIKISEILKNNDIKSVTVARMDVPCCGGLLMMVKRAIQNSGKDLPLHVSIIGSNGKVLKR